MAAAIPKLWMAPCMLTWGCLMNGTNSDINQFTGDTTAKDRMLHSIIGKDLTPHSICTLYFAALVTVVGGDQSILPAVLRYL
jgi:hypothetical protein